MFPQAVRDYVSRSFDEDVRVPGMEKRTIEMKLKDVITHYAQRGLLEQVDWANYPLPQTLLLEEARRPTHSSEWVQTPEAHAPASPSSATNTANFWPRKRKSPDDDARRPEDDVPPWKRNNHQRTAKQNDKRRRNEAAPSPGPSKFDRLQMDQRKKRFESFQPASPAVSLGTHVMDHEPQLGPVVGTCQDLEKAYFRLTAPPRAETVRPQAVLERTLEHLKAKWCAERNYDYICNQFKSMRQDLTVQHIQSAFTVKVYEQHARVALEMGDMGEYNQCQTQLRALYSQDLGGHPEEFLAYRILYLIYTCNTTHLNDPAGGPHSGAEEAQRRVLGATDAVRASHRELPQVFLALHERQRYGHADVHGRHVYRARKGGGAGKDLHSARLPCLCCTQTDADQKQIPASGESRICSQGTGLRDRRTNAPSLSATTRANSFWNELTTASLCRRPRVEPCSNGSASRHSVGSTSKVRCDDVDCAAAQVASIFTLQRACEATGWDSDVVAAHTTPAFSAGHRYRPRVALSLHFSLCTSFSVFFDFSAFSRPPNNGRRNPEDFRNGRLGRYSMGRDAGLPVHARGNEQTMGVSSDVSGGNAAMPCASYAADRRRSRHSRIKHMKRFPVADWSQARMAAEMLLALGWRAKAKHVDTRHPHTGKATGDDGTEGRLGLNILFSLCLVEGDAHGGQSSKTRTATHVAVEA